MREPANIRMIIVAALSRPTTLLHQQQKSKAGGPQQGKNKSTRKREQRNLTESLHIRTAKDLKLRRTCHMPRILRSFAVLRRHSTQRELIELGGRLRLSQDDTVDDIVDDIVDDAGMTPRLTAILFFVAVVEAYNRDLAATAASRICGWCASIDSDRFQKSSARP